MLLDVNWDWESPQTTVEIPAMVIFMLRDLEQLLSF